jgi:hypothetical protein
MDERRILEQLDAAVWKALRAGALDLTIRRVTSALARDWHLRIAWEPLPLGAYPALPADIASSWVFALRGGTTTGAERHPNSIQRVMGYRGRADLQTWERETWQTHVLAPDPQASLASRWLSIPKNVWHRPVIPTGPDWLVISFHTATADALIEERADDDEQPDSSLNVQERYAGRSAR